MRTAPVAAALALALGLLTGCTKGLDARVAKLEAENAQLKQQVESLSAGFRALTLSIADSPPGPRRAEGPPPELGLGPRRPFGPPGPPDGGPRGGPPRGRRP